MKYDTMREYKMYLLNTVGLSKETARTYYNRVDVLLERQSMAHIDIEKVLKELSKIKYKNHFSQSKNALLYFLQFNNIHLDNETLKRIKELEQNTHKKYRKLKPADFKAIDSTIKHLKNNKLKLSYQTMIETALRVSELAQIRANDCKVEESTIALTFRAKGGNKEEVVLRKEENELFFNHLKELIENTSQNKKVFYSAGYLQQKAKTYGFSCHDLRRASAKVEYKKTKSKNKVKEKLRHKSMKTTNLYLNSKIKIK